MALTEVTGDTEELHRFSSVTSVTSVTSVRDSVWIAGRLHSHQPKRYEASGSGVPGYGGFQRWPCIDFRVIADWGAGPDLQLDRRTRRCHPERRRSAGPDSHEGQP